MVQKRYEISDEQWIQIENLFPVAKTGRPPKDSLLMFNAVLWIVYFQLSSGNLHDSTLANDVLSHTEIKGSNILADKAYGTNEIREYITSQDATYTILPKSNTQNPWDCDWWIYKERHLVECFFNKIKHFRRCNPL